MKVGPQQPSQEYTGTDLEAMSVARNYNQWIADLISPYLGKRVAEVGAGNGNISILLSKLMIDELITFEPSMNMYSVLSQRLANNEKVVAYNETFAQKYTDYAGYFDSIIYINVLEHIEDDNEELSHVYSALKQGGHVCLFVPALSWLYSDFDKSIGHYRRYHKRSFIRQLETLGFKVSKIRYIDFFGILPWFIVFVLMKKTLTPGKTSLYDKFCIPVIRSIEGMLEMPIGKNLLLIAKK